tara:strand:+ start:359 stop:592 length:234 start_codon:yes stop_codon:yes gene_type:complete
LSYFIILSTKELSSTQYFLQNKLIYIDIICEVKLFMMNLLGSFALGGFVPSAAIAGLLLLVGLGAFFYLGIKGPTDY